MYRPPYTRTDDPALAHAIIDANPFAMLVTVGPDGAPAISHIPLQRDGDALIGHLARANPQSKHAGEAIAVFSGPHAYVSPTWYAEPAAHVPTWNYVAVHVTGALDWLDADGTIAGLDALVARYEPTWRPDPARQDALVRAIAGFRLPMTRVEAKLKLSQNRDGADFARVANAMTAAHADLAAWMASLGIQRT